MFNVLAYLGFSESLTLKVIKSFVVGLSSPKYDIPMAEPGWIVTDIRRVVIIVEGWGRLQRETLDWAPGKLVATVRVDGLNCPQGKIEEPSVEVKGLPKDQRAHCDRNQRHHQEVNGMSILRSYADIDSVPVMKFMVFVERSQVKDSVKQVVIGIFAEHAEVDLRDHHSEGVHFTQAFHWEIPKTFTAVVLKVGESYC